MLTKEEMKQFEKETKQIILAFAFASIVMGIIYIIDLCSLI